MADEKIIEQQENQKNLKDQNQENEVNQTQEELLFTLAEDFNKYFQQNKEKFKSSSLTDIFFHFLENKKKWNYTKIRRKIMKKINFFRYKKPILTSKLYTWRNFNKRTI